MIEKAIAAALEPLADEIVALVRRVDAIQAKEGPPGPAGQDGADGESVTPSEVAATLKADDEFIKAVKGDAGPAGKDGADVDMAAVATELKSDGLFVALLKGEPGERGPVGPAGQDGADAPPLDVSGVAVALKADTWFLAAVRGEKGDQGERGPAGVDGADAPPAEVNINDVVTALKADADFMMDTRGERGLPGAQGEKGDDGARGVDGLDGVDGAPGKDGRDGAGIDAPIFEVGKVYREGQMVQHYIGQHYRALKDTVAEPGDSDDWQRIGTSGLRCRGYKPDPDTLKEGDFYIDGGSSFLIVNGKATMFVQRGIRGERGEKGDIGERGERGADGRSIVDAIFTMEGFTFAFDDGSTQDFPLQGGEALKSLQAYASEMAELEADSGRVPIKAYAGQWNEKLIYRRGDVTVIDKRRWLAITNTGPGWIANQWVQL